MASERREPITIKVLLAFIAVVFLIGLLREFANIFVPFTVALLFFFLFNPLVKQLQKRRIPMGFVLVGLLLFIFLVLYSFGLLVYAGASSFVQDFPRYGERVSGLAGAVLTRLHIPLQEARRFTAGIDWTKVFNPEQLTALISATLGSFTSFVGNVVLIVLLLMFMLGGRVPLLVRVGRELPAERVQQMETIVRAIDTRVQRYLLIKTLMSLATAILAGLILLAGGVDFAVFSALLVFFFNFIPTFGSVIGTVFPVMIGLLEYGPSLRVLLVTLTLMAMQFIMGNVVEPQIAGRGLNLSPLVILLSLIFWGGLWGVVGMFLAVPLTSALKIIMEQVPGLRVAAAVLSDE
jgi:AI-2 transport protein TqsA